jgi:hypothetical protein
MSKVAEVVPHVFTAMFEIQNLELSVFKNANNPAYKSKYANLDAWLEVIRPELNKRSLLLTTQVASDALFVKITSMKDGSEIASIFTLPNIAAQELGKLLTYYTRYALRGLFGLPADEDDDANAAQAVTQSNQAVPEKKEVKWLFSSLGSDKEKVARNMAEFIEAVKSGSIKTIIDARAKGFGFAGTATEQVQKLIDTHKG